MKTGMVLFTAFFAALACLALPVRMADAAPAGGIAQAALIAQYTGPDAEGKISAALRISHRPGWHSYWRYSGDAGLPPQFDWAGSENLKDFSVSWPAPERHVEAGLNTFGYGGDVVLPVTAMAVDPAKASILRLKLSLLVCEQICVPEQFTLELPFAVEREATPDAKLIAQAYKTLPGKNGDNGLSIDGLVAGPEGIVLTISARRGLSAPDAFIEAEELGLTEKPAFRKLDEKGVTGQLVFSVPGDVQNPVHALDGKTVTVTLVDQGMAVARDFNF